MNKITSLVPPNSPLAFITEALIWVSCTAFVTTSLESMQTFWGKYEAAIANTLTVSIIIATIITLLIFRYIGKLKWLVMAVMVWRFTLIAVGFCFPLLGSDAHV